MACPAADATKAAAAQSSLSTRNNPPASTTSDETSSHSPRAVSAFAGGFIEIPAIAISISRPWSEARNPTSPANA